MNGVEKKLPSENVLDAFKIYEDFCKAMLDAYAIIDISGKIVKANPLFSQLVGMKSRQILKADSIDDMLTLNINEESLRVSDILQHKSATRIDEVRGRTAEREDLNLIIGVYPFLEDNNHLGSFILIRDVTAETNLQFKYKDKATQSITDPLTGLYNRAFFMDYIQSQISSLEQLPPDATQRIISVFMMDIDHFKQVNDVYGHRAGDYVLTALAGIMKDTLRRTDILCRYGGEEFLVILPGSDLQGGVRAADKLRTSVESFKFAFDGKEIPLTISAGVAQINIGREKGEVSIHRADDALYHAKECGRNQISFHDGKKTISA